MFIQPETAEKTNKKTIYSSNLITLTGQLSAASLIPASKSAKTTPCFTSEISITSNTSGHILSQLPHEMQSSSTQTLLIDIVLVINIISMISINPKTSNYCELFALLWIWDWKSSNPIPIRDFFRIISHPSLLGLKPFTHQGWGGERYKVRDPFRLSSVTLF